MKLSEEQLNNVYKNTDSLNEFLLACSNAYYDPLVIMNPFKSSTQNIEDLPERELIELFEWWKKKSAKQKYTIKVAPTSLGYFGIDYDEGDATIDSSKNGFYQTYFTKSEIEQLKSRDDLAIDWNKARIEPVEDNEDED